MKKLFSICFIIIILASAMSCDQDKALDPRPTIVDGQYVRLDITNPFIIATDINNTSFGGLLTTPSNTVVKYDMYVRYKNTSGVTEGNYVFYKSITSFPYDLKVTVAELAVALNKNVSDLKKGDKFNFLCYSYDSSGNFCDYNSLSSTVKSQNSMKQGYRFVTGIENIGSVFDNYEAPK